MSQASIFSDHTLESAPEGSRAALKAAGSKFGFVPAAMARMAESPAVVEAFGLLLRLFGRVSLSPLEREVLVLTVAHDVGCEVCVALHSAMLAAETHDDRLLGALRAQTPLTDPRLEALRQFTRAVLGGRGAVGAETMDAFLRAGFDRRQALEVVLGVATYTLSTFTNRMTGAPLDPAFEAFRWTAPA